MNKYLVENLFGIEGWNIAWYGVIIAVGMVLGVLLAVYRNPSLRFGKVALQSTVVCLEDW